MKVLKQKGEWLKTIIHPECVYKSVNPVRSVTKGSKSMFKEINQSLVTLDSVFNPRRAKEENERKNQEIEDMVNRLNQGLEKLDKHSYKYLLLCSMLYHFKVSTPSEFTNVVKNILRDKEIIEKEISPNDHNRFKEFVDALSLTLTTQGLELKDISKAPK
jgi:hypothetical protein